MDVYNAIVPYYPQGLVGVYIVLFTLYQFAVHPRTEYGDWGHPYTARYPLIIESSALINIISTRVFLYNFASMLIGACFGHTDYWSPIKFAFVVLMSIELEMRVRDGQRRFPI